MMGMMTLLFIAETSLIRMLYLSVQASRPKAEVLASCAVVATVMFVSGSKAAGDSVRACDGDSACICGCGSDRA